MQLKKIFQEMKYENIFKDNEMKPILEIYLISQLLQAISIYNNSSIKGRNGVKRSKIFSYR